MKMKSSEVIKIRSILTALGNKEQYNQLKKKGLNLIMNDIQYKEGILEYLDQNIDIDYLILNENLPGETDTKELLNNIQNKNNRIKVILITKKEDAHINVYQQIQKFDIKNILEIIEKSSIFKNQYIPISTSKKETQGKIITILGANGIGKSIFSVTLANNIKNKKVLIVDFDILNNSLPVLLGVKNYTKKVQANFKKSLEEENKNNIILFPDKTSNNKVRKTQLIKNKNCQNKKSTNNKIIALDYIIHTKYQIDLLSAINIIINLNEKEETENIVNKIIELKNTYDIIIIDTSTIDLFGQTKTLIEKSDNSIFLSGANVLEIKKAKQLLKIYEKDWEIDKNKIQIVFNKYSKKSIDNEVLYNIFRNYKILGKISLNEYFDRAINKNNIKIDKIQDEVKTIKEKIQKEKETIKGLI